MNGEKRPVFPDGGRPLQSRGCVGILLRGRGRSAAIKVAPQMIFRLSLFFPWGESVDGRFFVSKSAIPAHGHSNRWQLKAGKG